MDFLAQQVPPSVDSLRCRLRFDLNDLVEADEDLDLEQQLILSGFIFDRATDQDLSGNVSEVYDRYKRALLAFYKVD
jgi:hypothetical protein